MRDKFPYTSPLLYIDVYIYTVQWYTLFIIYCKSCKNYRHKLNKPLTTKSLTGPSPIFRVLFTHRFHSNCFRDKYLHISFNSLGSPYYPCTTMVPGLSRSLTFPFSLTYRPRYRNLITTVTF